MEPIKFEDNIREKLQNREIAPSEDAWKKLNLQLGTSPKKGKNKTIWFLVAASFIGIIVITTILFNNKIIPNQVSTEIVEESPKEIEEFIPEQEKITAIDVKSETNSNQNKISEKSKINNTLNNNKSKKLTKITKTETLIAKKEELKTHEEVLAKNDEELFNTKVEEVVAQVQTLKKENESVSMDEINALLLNAQKEMNREEISFENNKKINPKDLLDQVESEMEKSFRDKVFDALGNGYEKLRTAVVDKNN